MNQSYSVASPQTAGGRVAEAWDKFKRLIDQQATSDRICNELSKLLGVRQDGVALLRLDKGMLRFLYPAHLRTTGTIPVSSPAVAARTASTRTTMLSNNFARVRHASVFEGIKPEDSEAMPIQKMMSVPIFNADRGVLGVIQVSRKGRDPSAAGKDFTHEDLRMLEEAASEMSKLPWMLDSEVASGGVSS
jgi:GAF domain